MGAPQPGWYPDPGGCWDDRWWDGQVWTNGVRTGQSQSEDPYPPRPVNDRTQVIWSCPSHVARLGEESYRLNWEAVHILDRRMTTKESIPIWGIQSIEVRISAAQHVRGLGDVVLAVGYSGYFGPSTFVLRGVDDPHSVKAAVRRQIGIWNLFR